MKHITKINPDPGAQSYDVVNMAQENVYITQMILPYTIIDPSESIAADVAFYDGEKVIIVRANDYSQLPKSWMPIGIVVVPGTHNVYGDGSCGVMSLKAMNCDTPSAGSTSEQYMHWGVDGTDISGLPNLDMGSYVGTGSNAGDASSTLVGQANITYLPSDRFNTVQCPHDTDVYYDRSSYATFQAPSPYLTDGSRNPAYYQTTSPSSERNCLVDFDGIGNTAKIIEQRGPKDYSSWKPSITGSSSYPAASCCDMFYTNGTQQGDWYLPACGELGYLIPPFNKINESITNLLQAYGSSVGVELFTNTNRGYWSSTEFASYGARFIHPYSGGVRYYNKDNSNRDTPCVRAFLRVGPNGVIQ